MKRDAAYGFFNALKNSLSALSDVIASAGPVPADAPERSLFLSTEKIYSDGGGECTATFKIRYFSPNMILGDDGGILNAIAHISLDGRDLTIQKYECRHCGRYFDITAAYSFPSLFFEYGSDGGTTPVMSSVDVKITIN